MLRNCYFDLRFKFHVLCYAALRCAVAAVRKAGYGMKVGVTLAETALCDSHNALRSGVPHGAACEAQSGLSKLAVMHWSCTGGLWFSRPRMWHVHQPSQHMAST